MKKIESYWWKILLIGILLITAWKLIDIPAFLAWLGVVVGILMPFIVGAVLAFFTAKPASLLEKYLIKKFKKLSPKKARSLSVLAVYVVLIALLTLILKFLIPAIYRNMQDLVANAPSYYITIKNYLGSIDALKSFNIFDRINETVMSYLNLDMMGKFVNIVSTVANSVITFFLSIIISIYILIEKDNLKDFIKTLTSMLLNSTRAKVLAKYTGRLVDIFNSYFLGLVLDALIVGAVSTVFLAIFGAPYPWLLGLVVALGNMIPFFGPIVSAIVEYIATAIVLGPMRALWVLVFQIVIGQLDGNLLQPKIVGTSVGISPFWVIFAVTFFGGFWGPWGMILGVPIVAALRIVYLSCKNEIAPAPTNGTEAQN